MSKLHEEVKGMTMALGQERAGTVIQRLKYESG